MKINIAYSCDDNYIEYTGISMISLFENNKGIEHINIYFISKCKSNSSVESLKNIALSYNRCFIVIPFESICFDLNIDKVGRHLETIYAKLFFSRITDIDKILYLDSDTIIVDNLKKLWDTNMDNYLIAGVETYTVDVKEKLELRPEDSFINDGIVLLNLDNIRKLNMITVFNSFINKHNGNPPLLSEGTINYCCKNKILQLDPSFNLMSGFLFYKKSKHYKNKYLKNYYSIDTIKNSIKNPAIIHYLAAFYNRPWNKSCSHPLKSEYLYYKSISPWKNSTLRTDKQSRYLRLLKFILKYFPFELILMIRFLKKKIKKSYV